MTGAGPCSLRRSPATHHLRVKVNSGCEFDRVDACILLGAAYTDHNAVSRFRVRPRCVFIPCRWPLRKRHLCILEQRKTGKGGLCCKIASNGRQRIKLNEGNYCSPDRYHHRLRITNNFRQGGCLVVQVSSAQSQLSSAQLSSVISNLLSAQLKSQLHGKQGGIPLSSFRVGR